MIRRFFSAFVRTEALDPTDIDCPVDRPAKRQEQGTSGRGGGQDFRTISNRPIPPGRNTDIPIRFLKDPLGVIKAYKLVKQHIDVQLVLAGGGATDDPEGPAIMQQVQEEADKDKDIFVLFLPPSSDIEINALQRGSTVVSAEIAQRRIWAHRLGSHVEGKTHHCIGRRRNPAPDCAQTFRHSHTLGGGDIILDQAIDQRAGIRQTPRNEWQRAYQEQLPDYTAD